jgi:hypothetical protein
MNMMNLIESSILVIRDVPVILDGDVATFYGVETKHINQAVKNNPEKFLDGYVITVEKEEKYELVKNFDRFNNLKHSTVPVKAFTEKGLYMLATILKSPQATQTTLAIIETFTKIRELGRNIKELTGVTSETEKKRLMQKTGEIVTDIFADELDPLESETTIELNFAMLKFKHTVKRDRKRKPKK